MTFMSFDDWVADARAADLVETAGRLGATLKASGGEMVGPCPGCGGTDRFAISPRKRLWNCGHAGGAGGDVIALVGHVRGWSPSNPAEFVMICEEIVGAPPPGRDVTESDADRVAREARQAERARDRAAADRRREEEAASYRDAEIRRALEIWEEGRRIDGTPAAAYLAARGIRHVAGLRLRFVERVGYFVRPVLGKGFVKIGDFPAMVGAIADAEGRFRGVHLTHLDPDRPAKASIRHPETGAAEPAKKIRGSVHGGILRLAGPVADPRRLVCGEGIETTLSVRDEEIDAGRDLAATAWVAGISLGNMGGRATTTVHHPLGLTRTDKAGRTRIVSLPGPVPAPGSEGIVIPDSVTEALILGDGDSDPATTEFATRRCAARWVRSGRTVRRAWARDGEDFNDMRRAS
jgi:hypothetical protein